MPKEPVELPKYRISGGIEWYQSYLPEFYGLNLAGIVGKLVKERGSINILDIGAGDFTFLRECVENPTWRGRVRATGVSADNFLSPSEKAMLSRLGIRARFITTAQVPKELKPEYDLAVSVLTNIYDPETDYLQIMWHILKDKGVGLLDQGAAVLPEKISTWLDIQNQLQAEGYEVEFTIRPVNRLLPEAQYPRTPPPPVIPAPLEQRDIYLKEIDRLAQPVEAPPEPYQEVSVAFKKKTGIKNLGDKIAELRRRK